MTDRYKEEFEEASDWLKFAFHARQEFPDYPYINADYEDVKVDFEYAKREVLRFAGDKSFAYGCCTHWRSISKDGCRALKDCGVRVLNATYGEVEEYKGDPSVLPYGHAGRLLQNRKPETKLFKRDTCGADISSSISGYNHMTTKQQAENYGTLKTVYDKETGLHFKSYMTGLLLNICEPEKVKEIAEENVNSGNDFIGYAFHEQYFYPDYYAYQPNYMERLYTAAKIFSEAGYEHTFIEELADINEA